MFDKEVLTDAQFLKIDPTKTLCNNRKCCHCHTDLNRSVVSRQLSSLQLYSLQRLTCRRTMLSFGDARTALDQFQDWISKEFFPPYEAVCDEIRRLETEEKSLREDLDIKREIFDSQIRSQWYVMRYIDENLYLGDHMAIHIEYCQTLKKKIKVVEDQIKELEEKKNRYREVTRLWSVAREVYENLDKEEIELKKEIEEKKEAIERRKREIEYEKHRIVTDDFFEYYDIEITEFN